MVHYPLLSEAVGNMVAIEETTQQLVEGSGEEGSGEEIEPMRPTTFPFYDELMEAQTPIFDYGADGEMSTKEICRCPDEDDECGFSSQEQIMEVDKSIRLSFCKPVDSLLPKCRGRRGLLRIIGEVDAKSGEGISSINDTVVFCRCTSPFRRVSIEPWMEKYSFNYRCGWSPE